ncbi:EAL domain-containing protein [Aliikangiella marina]|uniref:EAL domain-containing protein n=1 Tax=Aliikangiella marina TaxID=1712262 RepID=UPI00163DC5AB|nr:EAL domain-containing protein [Aliikangiella marina]
MKLIKYLNFCLLLNYLFANPLLADDHSSSLLKQVGVRQFSTEQGLSQNTVNRFFQDRDGFVWIGTEAGLNRLTGTDIDIYNGPDNEITGEAISTIKEDSFGALWVATFENLYRINPERTAADAYILPQLSGKNAEDNFVIDVFEESPGQFWVVTRDAILGLTTDTNDVQAFPSSQRLWQDKAFITSAENDDGYFWLSTTQGVYRFNKQSKAIDKINLLYPFNEKIITQTVKTSANTLFIASLQGALHINLANSNNPTSLVSRENINTAQLFNQQVIFASGDKTFVFDTETKETKHLFSLSEVLPKYSSYSIEKLFIDANNKVWLGTESQGAFIWDPASLKFQTISRLTANSNLKLSNPIIWSFTETETGDFWLGSDDGLNFLDVKNATLTQFLSSEQEILKGESTRMLYMLKKENNLWLATGNGLIKFDTQTFEHKLFRPDRLKASQEFLIYAITESPDGNLWLASEQGAIAFNPTTERFKFPRTLYANDNPEPVTFIRYTGQSLWIGYANRLDKFDPKSNQKSTVFRFSHLKKRYDLSLTDIFIDGNKLWVSFNAAGIYILDLTKSNDQEIKHLQQKTGFPDNIIHALQPDNEHIWASSHAGLIKINREDFSFRVFDYYNGLPTNEFNEGAAGRLSNGQLIFGGTNGVLIFDPKALDTESNDAPIKVTQIASKSEQYQINAFDWLQRSVLFSEKDKVINFKISMLDYISPHKWQYEYWLTGDTETEVSLASGNQISIVNLPAGDYQLNIQAANGSDKSLSTVTIPFEISPFRDFWFYLKLFAGFIIIAGSLALLINRQKQYEKVLDDNTSLESSKKKLELALFSHVQGTWEWSRFGPKITDSRLKIQLPQRDPQTYDFNEYGQLIHEEDQNKNKVAWYKFYNGEQEEIVVTYRVFILDEWIWCRVQGKLIKRDREGKPVKAIGTWTDVTEERQQSIKSSICEQAVQATRDIVVIADNQFNIAFINNAYELLTGYSGEKLIGRNILDIIYSRFEKETAQKLEKQLREKRAWQGETSLPTKSGASFVVDIRIDPFSPTKPESEYVILMTDTSTLSHRTEAQESAIYFDSITGLPNRVLALDRLSHAIAHARLNKTNVALIKLDIDKFDFYQHTLGKSQAREILVGASQRITEVLNKDDTFARIEQDKFFIILENEDKVENISFKIEDILNQLSKSQLVGHSTVNVTACVGVACFPLDASNSSDLITHADEALGQAQTVGENQISFYHREMNKRASDRLAMKSSLKQAIQNNQFYLVFQPKFELASEKFHGFEVFVRWRTPDGNIIYPSQFLKIAEETGLIESLTEWLINQAFRTLNRWKEDGFHTIFSINLHPKYCQRIGSPDYLLEKIKAYGLSTMNLQVEINEKHFATELSSNIEFVNQLKQNGFTVTLDDFGAGNTPLNYLKVINVDSIKLERNFIRSIGQDANNDALLKSIIDMANALDRIPAAKSIEYQEQLDFLIEAGCQVGQGYYFSDPLTESGARRFMLHRPQKNEDNEHPTD